MMRGPPGMQPPMRGPPPTSNQQMRPPNSPQYQGRPHGGPPPQQGFPPPQQGFPPPQQGFPPPKQGFPPSMLQQRPPPIGGNPNQQMRPNAQHNMPPNSGGMQQLRGGSPPYQQVPPQNMGGEHQSYQQQIMARRMRPGAPQFSGGPNVMSRQGSQWRGQLDGSRQQIPRDVKQTTQQQTLRKNRVPTKRVTERKMEKLSELVNDDEESKRVDESYLPNGGLQTFQKLVVVSEGGDLGAWTGYNWKGTKIPLNHFLKLSHDNDGRLWCINGSYEVGKMVKQGYKNLGFLGNQEIADIAFDNNNTLWGLSRAGDIMSWNGFGWEPKEHAGFHKLTALAFDRKDAMWCANSLNELAVWDSNHKAWDQKHLPANTKVMTLDFDSKNNLWILGATGELMMLSGSKFINYGWVSCWRLQDISFRRQPKLPLQSEEQPTTSDDAA